MASQLRQKLCDVRNCSWSYILAILRGTFTRYFSPSWEKMTGCYLFSPLLNWG